MYLTTRSDFSFLRSYGTIDQIVDRAVELGHTYVGLADYLSTWGHIKFLRACKAKSIKPILGVCVPVVKDVDKDPRYDLVSIIAKNNDGLQAIYKLLGSAAEQKYYRNRVTWNQIYALKDVFLVADHVAPANSYLVKEGVLISLSPQPGAMMHMAKGNTWAAFNPSPVYPSPQSATGHKIITNISAMGRMGELKIGFGPMLSRDEAIAQFDQFDIDPRMAMENSDSIAAVCNVTIETARNVIPDQTMTVEQWARAGADERGVDLTDEKYDKRFNVELDIIRQKNFEDYFLLVADLVRYAKEHMLVGPGRGSSGGSLICFLMGITELDPIVHGTLFERFIDPTRSDYPDIDIDFPDAKRHMVFDYLGKKYGAECVAKIGTINEFKNKNSIDDCAKALRLPFDVTRQLKAALPDDIPLSEAFQREDIKGLIKNTPKITQALLLEGHARHSGTHAAGVCVSADPITNFASIADGVASITLGDAEAVGLLKIDALGLKTLSVIEVCCELASLEPSALYDLPRDDSAVWKIFNEDQVAGVFQFEGHTVRQLTKQITVDKFSDLYCLSSLARPGPLDTGSAADWCKRRGGADWHYLHESLVDVLEETDGIIIFQEQAMRIATEIGGLADPNKFRKAISKKDPAVLHDIMEEFMTGATRIMERRFAQVLWDQLESFGGYGFNKSHAVAYSMLTYIVAYLKAYYPVEFAVASLRRQADDDKAKVLLRELMDEGYDFVPFDPDKSEASWSFADGKIYGGFTSVKGVGNITAEKLISQRKGGGEGWLELLTPVQRKRLLSPNNTPWHDIDRMGRLYSGLYKDPDNYKTQNIPGGISGKVYKIASIPEGKSNDIKFIGRLKRKQYRDKNDPADVNKRDGQKISGPSVFLNLYFEDDTGDVGCTVSRFKYPGIGEAIWNDEDAEGKDYLVKGAIINDDRVWIFVDKVVEISNDKRKPNEQPQATTD